MGIFSRKPKIDIHSKELDQLDRRLLLHVGPGGWSARLMEADGSTRGETSSWDALDLKETGHLRIIAIIKNAVAKLNKELLSASQIALVIDGIGVLFTDNKPKALTSASPPSARHYGQQLLHVPEVTFGHAEFHSFTGEHKAIKNGVFAFADAQILRNVLASFDKEGLKLREVIPTGFLVFQRAARQPTVAYGGIYLGAFATTLTLFHHDIGSLFVRSIDVGYLTLAQAIASTSGISITDSLDALTKKNLLQEIDPSKPNDSMNQSMQAQALAPLLIRLLRELTEAIEFFTYQRVSGIPKELEFFGEADRIQGLTDWLANNLDIPFKTQLPSILTLYQEAHHPLPCNLLKGAETSLFSIGRNKFYFTEKKGFVRSKDLEDENIAQVKKSSSLRSRSARGQTNRRNSARQGGSSNILDQVRALFKPKENQGVTAAQELEEVINKQENMFFAGFGFLVMAILYWGYSEYDAIDVRHRKSISNYINLRSETDKLDKSLGGGNIARLSGERTLTKVLWTEKFLSLANNISIHIWLTDVFLTTESRSVGDVSVEGKKLVVNGGVLPSTDGHIKKIADYLKNLLGDSQQFMSDFRTVTFSGSQMEQSDNDPIVRFSFEAWYDKNVRLEQIKENQPGNHIVKEMRKNYDKRDKALEDALSGAPTK